MAAPSTFDTLDYARKLEKAGVPATQAEMQAQALAQVFAESVASRSDLFGVEQRLDTSIDTVESRLTAKIEAVESRLDAKIDTVESRLTAKIDGIESRLDAKIDTVESRLTAKIAGIESRLDAKIDAVKTELTLDLGGRIDTLKWMVTFFGAVNVGILVKLLVS